MKLLLWGFGLLGICGISLGSEGKPLTIWKPIRHNYTPISRGNRGIYYIILHTTESRTADALAWFRYNPSNVSAHYIVSRSGRVTQVVADKNIAWHAGNNRYNRHSIGIEHEGYAYRKGTWTLSQYRASAALTRWLSRTYGIPRDRRHILGHNQIPGAEHGDPGPYFNWRTYMMLVKYDDSAKLKSETRPSPPSPKKTAHVSEPYRHTQIVPTTTAVPCNRFPKTVRPTARVLNVRSGPGRRYVVIGRVYRGQKYVATRSSHNWYKIWYDGKVGWSYGGYLSWAPYSSMVEILRETTSVYKGPGICTPVIGKAFKGQLYGRMETRGKWYRISYLGKCCWLPVEVGRVVRIR